MFKKPQFLVTQGWGVQKTDWVVGALCVLFLQDQPGYWPWVLYKTKEAVTFRPYGPHSTL